MSDGVSDTTGTFGVSSTPSQPALAHLNKLARFAAEVVHCGRPVHTLSTFITANVQKQLQLQQDISRSRMRSPKPVVAWGSHRASVHVFQHKPDLIDCVGTFICNDRAFAVTIRLQFRHNRWRASEISVL